MKIVSAILLMLAFAVHGNAQNVIYSWVSPNGVVDETGGKIAQHNSLGVSRINFRSSGYHTIQLCGKKENINDEDNTLNSVYFTISLTDGNIFKGGDKIIVTAMRNNDDGGKSNIHFIYGNGTTYDDTNTWANLGQMHEITIHGGTEAKSMLGTISSEDAGTEPIDEYALEPSTNSFNIPEEAAGSSNLTLTRNESECMLYITEIKVTRDVPADIESVNDFNFVEKSKGNAFNLSGQRVNSNVHGIVIKNGKKIIQ